MFHLTTHAFFKALLFLGSGSVIHGCHHEQDIFKMGGLARRMPLTFVDLHDRRSPRSPGYRSWRASSRRTRSSSSPTQEPGRLRGPALTAVLTAFYMVRLWKIVFLGAPRSEAAEHAHEGGIRSRRRWSLLAALSVVGGYTVFTGVLSPASSRGSRRPGRTQAIILVTSLRCSWWARAAALASTATDGADALARARPGLFGFLARAQVLLRPRSTTTMSRRSSSASPWSSTSSTWSVLAGAWSGAWRAWSGWSAWAPARSTSGRINAYVTGSSAGSWSSGPSPPASSDYRDELPPFDPLSSRSPRRSRWRLSIALGLPEALVVRLAYAGFAVPAAPRPSTLWWHFGSAPKEAGYAFLPATPRAWTPSGSA